MAFDFVLFCLFCLKYERAMVTELYFLIVLLLRYFLIC